MQHKKFFFCVIILIISVCVSVSLMNGHSDYYNTSEKSKTAKIGVKDSGRIIPQYIEGEVLVKFKQGISKSSVKNVAASLSMNVANNYKSISKILGQQYAHVRSKNQTTERMIEQLKNHPYVQTVSPNYIQKIVSNIPNDTRFDELWGLHNTGQTGGINNADINAPEAWDVTTGSAGVIVGVIDTGIDYNHPDLSPNLWVNPNEIPGDNIDNDSNGYIDDIYGMNGIDGSGDPFDDHGHGTHCAGTIGAAGNNGIGVAGVNWNVKMISGKFLDSSGYGSDADAIKCIDYFVDLKTTFSQNIVAINASWGGGGFNQSLKDSIDAAGAAGIVFCAAAGNDDTDNDIAPHYPSSYDSSSLIAVTATKHDNSQVYNYGASSVDIGAPGYDILSTIPGMYLPQSGDIFFDDMESGSGNWTTGGTNNTWAITTDQENFANTSFPVPSPPNFWSDSPGANYVSNTDSWLMNSSDIDLSGYTGQDVYIGFGSAMYVEDYFDHAYVEVSGDSGSTWTTLMDFSGYAYFWQEPYFYKIPDAVKTTQFRFRFRLVSDYIVEYWGWLIDDVGIGTDIVYSYDYKSGTSMATPHVAGAIAFMTARFPGDSLSERIDRILDNVTPLSSLSGKCVTGGMLNLHASTVSIVVISGTVETSGGNPIQGVVMNGLPGSPSTDVSGYFEEWVPQGWSGTITPTKSGYGFTPFSKSYPGVTDDQTDQDFIGQELGPHTVSIPTAPTGPASGKTYWDYLISTSGSFCSHYHDVEYQFDWGDGPNSGWTLGGQLYHSWSAPGTYTIKSRARCTVDNGIISDWSAGTSIDIVIAWSGNNRMTWYSGNSLNPEAKSDSSDNLYVFWQDDRNGDMDLYLKKTTDGGKSWGILNRITYTARTSGNPALVIGAGDTLHLFWNEYYAPDNSEIVHKSSTDGGGTWSVVNRLTWNSGFSLYPSAAHDSTGNLHVVWEDNASGSGEIYHKTSTDSGATWSSNNRLTWSSGIAGDPKLAIDPLDNLHLVWYDSNSGDPEIYYKKSTDGGITWSPPERLVWKNGNSRNPFVTTGSGNSVYVCWQDDGYGNFEIFSRTSTDGGFTWEANNRETWMSGDSKEPFFAYSGTIGHILWSDNHPGNYDLYYRRSDLGIRERLTWNSGASINPVAVVDSSGTVHVFWADNTSGNYEIYFKKR